MSGRVAFSVCVRMETDWHVGSGWGRRGAIDKLVARDADDLPYIPAKTLKGVWRDAAEQLAFGLNDKASGGWDLAVDLLFGHETHRQGPEWIGYGPLEARLELGAATYIQDLRSRVVGADPFHSALRQGLTLIRSGVRIDHESGTADPKHLRFVEYARGGDGCSLEALASLNVDDLEVRAAEALSAFAVGALWTVEALGGDRRRGAGMCRIEAPELATLDAAVDALRSIPASEADALFRPAVKRGRAKQAADPAPKWRRVEAQSWRGVTLEIEALEPLLISEATRGNVIECRSDIPGATLLPLLQNAIEIALRRRAPAGVDQASLREAARDIILNGAVRVFPAYPAGQRRARAGGAEATHRAGAAMSYPAPFVWRREKDGTGGLDGEGAIINELASEEAAPSSKQSKPFRGDVFIRNGSAVLGAVGGKLLPWPGLVSAHKSLRTQNVVEDATQTPTADVGGVYVYEAMEPGSVFATEIWLDSASVRSIGVEDIAAALTEIGQCRLGRSKRAGFGLCRLNAGRPVDDPSRSGSIAGRIAGRPRVGGVSGVSLWFVTDLFLPELAFVCGENAASSTRDVLAEALRLALGFEKAPCLPSARANIRVERLDGWHAAWGLPRPTLLVIKAGSVVTIKGADQVSPEAWTALQAGGLGERRTEGFGRVEVAHPLVDFSPEVLFEPQPKESQESAATGLAAMPPPDDGFLETAGEARPFLRETLKRILRAEVAYGAELFGEAARAGILGWDIRPASTDSGPRAAPNMSQLGALRAAMGALETDDDERRLKSWLQGKKSRLGKSKWRASGFAPVLAMLADETSEQEQAATPKTSEQVDRSSSRDPWALVSQYSAAPEVLAWCRRELLASGEASAETSRRYALKALLLASMFSQKRALERERASAVPELRLSERQGAEAGGDHGA